jgi:hypothetical protein
MHPEKGARQLANCASPNFRGAFAEIADHPEVKKSNLTEAIFVISRLFFLHFFKFPQHFASKCL